MFLLTEHHNIKENRIMQLLSDYIDIEKEFNNIFVLDKKIERYKLIKVLNRKLYP